MAWSNTPGDPVGQRQKALAEEERRLAEETAKLRREMARKAEQEAAEARAARLREENPGMAAQEDEPVPVLRHSAARRQDRARFFVLLFLLGLAVLWIVRVLR
jgi:hypothetical protein